MVKMYDTKRIFLARISVNNNEYELKKLNRGMKTSINLSTTRKTTARRPEKSNEIFKISGSSKGAIIIILKDYEVSLQTETLNEKKIFG